uniref:Cytohesin Ubiquitin Protein Inducing domain-containing protein n=1 Tax=Esox lucius TaxID=8010 RepID=A0A3P8Y332_ESOLU
MMDSEDIHREEISDTDSGIMLNSGPDSPMSQGKDLNTHTRAMRLRHQALEERLELCMLELRKLCIREAELTGKLSSDFPLLPDEKPPRIRRRIGATFKLDDSLIHQDGEDSELHSLEADLALQLQIFEAARRLSVEEHLSKPQKKSRLQQCKREERKVKDLQEALFQHRIRKECSSPPTNNKNNSAKHQDQDLSDDSSLSDGLALDDDVEPLRPSGSSDPLLQSSPGSLSIQYSSEGSLQHISAQSQSLGSSCSVEQTQAQFSSVGSSCSMEQTQAQFSSVGSSCSVEQTQAQFSSVGSSCSVEQTQFSSVGSSCSVEYPERSPIQNSPWKESSLDQPYLKPKKPLSACSSRSSSPVGIPVFPADSRVLPSHFPSIKNLAVRHGQTHSCSAPSTPELHVRRQYSQSFRVSRSKPGSDPNESRGQAKLPRRKPEFMVRSPQYSPLSVYQSSSEDSSSEHSAPSYTGSPCRGRDRDQDREGPAPTEIPKLCPPPYGFHYGAQSPNGHVINGPNRPGGFYNNSQHQSSPSLRRRGPEEHPCSPLPPQGRDSPGENGLCTALPGAPQPRQRQEGQGPPPAFTRRVLKPPPPYTRLVRTPSLREYPNHPARVLPREMVSEELRSWHQRNHFQNQSQNQFQMSRPCSLERQGSFRIKSPASAHLPPYMQVRSHPNSQHRSAPQSEPVSPGDALKHAADEGLDGLGGSGRERDVSPLFQGPHQTVILQRAEDGTPVQWFVEEDSEIVSQV